jgi:hypothetical protein
LQQTSTEKLLSRLEALSDPTAARRLACLRDTEGCFSGQQVTLHDFTPDAGHAAFLADRDKAMASKARRRRRPSVETTDIGKAHALGWRLRQERIRKRIDQGFVYGPGVPAPKGAMIYGHYIERGLRSVTSGSPSLKLFAAALPKRVTCGDDKGAVWIEPSKVDACDRRMVTIDKVHLKVHIVDLDFLFAGEDDLLAKIASLIPDKKKRPNILTGNIRPDGSIDGCHAAWLLPPGKSVWNDPTNPNCKPKPIEMYHTVHRGLIQLLLPIGADPGQLANPWKTKNPLSTWNDTIIPNEHWNSLYELRSLVKDIGPKHLHKVAMLKRVSNKTQSCSDWHIVGDLCSDALTKAQAERSPDYVAVNEDPAGRRAWLRSKVIAKAVEMFGALTDDMRTIIESRTEYSADHWAPSVFDEIERGRDADVIAESEREARRRLMPSEKQRIAQGRTQEQRHSTVIETVVKVLFDVVPEGEEPTKKMRTLVVSRCKGTIGKSAIYSNWNEAVKMFARRFRLAALDKKRGTTSEPTTIEVGKINLASCLPETDRNDRNPSKMYADGEDRKNQNWLSSLPCEDQYEERNLDASRSQTSSVGERNQPSHETSKITVQQSEVGSPGLQRVLQNQPASQGNPRSAGRERGDIASYHRFGRSIGSDERKADHQAGDRHSADGGDLGRKPEVYVHGNPASAQAIAPRPFSDSHDRRKNFLRPRRDFALRGCFADYPVARQTVSRLGSILAG